VPSAEGGTLLLMKILLTGASGFLGSHTAEELSNRGHWLYALVRKTSKTHHLKNLNTEMLEGSLSKLDALDSILPKVEVVIHIAGVVKALSAKEFEQVNVEGTQNVVRKVLGASRRPQLFIYISTIAVHDPRNSPNFCLPPEDCHPLSDYGKSKQKGELALNKLQGKVRTVILRPPLLYGPNDVELLPMFRAINHGIVPLYQSGKNQFSACYVGDVAKAISDLAEGNHSTDEIYCLDDGDRHSWRSFALEVGRVLNKKPMLLPIPKPIFYVAGLFSESWAKLRRRPAVFTTDKIREMKQKSWICGHQKLMEQTGWKPKVKAAEGLKITLQSYQTAGLL